MKRRQFLTTTTVAASTIAVAGCGGGSGSSEPQGEVTAEVTLTEGEAFDPLRVHVAEGEAVRWINETGEQRTVRANTEVDNSNEWELDLAIAAGESGAHTFQSSGVYSYHDAQDTHFLMCGAVAVGDTSEDDVGSLPCE
ncbi:plastocyanin/azurin family copper-binding protein [Halobacteria archaeon HArc-gm2]|nr:plastocyanin/azurin family copper-binding protein [Halobacteria archaeon HArc-gm2]